MAGRDDLIQTYLDAIDTELSWLDRPQVDTVFIGGGTPTHLSPAQLTRLLQIVAQRFVLGSGLEWSVEANPEDITAEKLQVLSDHGVNRISLGVQSFNDQKLKRLERSHTGLAAAEMVRLAASVIPNVSLDLIFAAPDETLDQWLADLDTALSLPITHLSTYALTYEKGTSFWTRKQKGELSGAGEQLEVDFYNAARQRTSQQGWTHYEISSFAKNDLMCRHNLAYWKGRGWFAAGPGAASFLDGRRDVNHRSTTTYLKRMSDGVSPLAEFESITKVDYARERAAFGVRMLAGIDPVKLSRETGVDLLVECRRAIDECTQNGWVEQHGSVLRLTERGVLFADAVAAAFLCD